jgi:hypothetical protein
MKRFFIYILLAFMFWTLPALATTMRQEATSSAKETTQAVGSQNHGSETTSATEPATALLLGAGLIGLVTFSRSRVRDQ